MRGVDAHELGACAEIDFDQLPAVGKLAAGLVRSGKPNPRARRCKPGHRSRVGYVSCDSLATRERDIGEEALVAPDQSRGDQRGGKAHQATKVPPRSSSIWTRMISSKLPST